MTKESETLEQLKKRRRTWIYQGHSLRIIHALLGITAIVSSLLVAAKINSFKSEHIEWLAFTAAVSIGLLNGFDIGSKANRMIRAWRKLNTAIFRYEGSSDATIEELIKAYEEAEIIIGDVKEEPR